MNEEDIVNGENNIPGNEKEEITDVNGNTEAEESSAPAENDTGGKHDAEAPVKSATAESDTPDGGVYTYDADDEPVDDRDIYSDKGSGTEKKVSEQPVEMPPSARSRKPAAAAPAKEYVIRTGSKSSAGEEHARTSVSPERESVSNNRLSRVCMVNTIISMMTLCFAAAAVFTGYAYMKKMEHEINAERSRIGVLEEKNEDTAPEITYREEYVDAISLIDEEEKNEPDVPAANSIDIENGKILIYDSYVGYSWVPVLSGVKVNEYDRTAFRNDSRGHKEYVVDGEVSSYFGIDVSAFQGDIDWNAVRADGVEFAILRIGVRGYGEEGNIRADDKFIQNYNGAHDAGIDVGVYFYSQAITVDEAVEEAEFVLKQLDGRKLEYPVVFDWEPVDIGTAESTPRTEDVMPGTLTLGAIGFCEKIKDAGYDAMVYTNKKMAYIKYDMRMLSDYPVWLALYSDDLTYYYDFDIWQYGYGKVDGIDGDVDLDIAMIR